MNWETVILKLKPTKTDGVKNVRTKTIKTVSDIEPKKYTYKIVNTLSAFKNIIIPRVWNITMVFYTKVPGKKVNRVYLK